MKKLANYTTQVPVAQTLAEIQQLLVEHGASSVMIDYDPERLPAALSFVILHPRGPIQFRLPCDWRAAMAVLERQKILRPTNRSSELQAQGRAQRIAWRICGDWLRAQMALVEIGAAVLEQVMLPYAVTPTGETVYQRVVSTGFLLTDAREGAQ